MTQNNYAFQGFNKDLMARAMGRDLTISTKQAIEMCNYLRNRKVLQAKTLLTEILAQKKALPFKRFTNGLGHKPGKMASGRYPVKASRAFMGLLESVEANAQTKGLNTSELDIIHLCAHKASSPLHHGRNYGREFKRTHVELVVQESSAKKVEKKKAVSAKAPKKDEIKDEIKSDLKPEAPKAETKVEEKTEAPKKEEPKSEPKSETKPEPNPESKAAETKDDTEVDESKTEVKK